MSRLLLATAVFAIAPVQADAHAGERGWQGADDPEKMLRKMERVVDLDEVQAQAIRNAVLAAQPALDEVREQSKANRHALRALQPGSAGYQQELARLAGEHGQLAGRKLLLQGQLRAEIVAQLDDEQRAALAAAMERRKAHRQGRRAERRRHRDSARD